MFISTYKSAAPIAGLQYLLVHHALVLFESTQAYINQLEFDYIIGLCLSVLEFEPLTLRSSNYQAETPTIELTRPHWANSPTDF